MSNSLALSVEFEQSPFNKQLLYNQDVEAVFPDFVLTDCTSGEVLMEVFRRSDDSYSERKIEKSAYYNRRYGVENWWSWDAGQGQTLPPFPPVGVSAGAK